MASRSWQVSCRFNGSHGVVTKQTLAVLHCTHLDVAALQQLRLAVWAFYTASASFLQELCTLTGRSSVLQQHLSRCSFVIPEPMLPATLQQHLIRCSLVTPQPLLPVPQRQPQTSHQTASALGGQKDQAGSSPGTALPKRRWGCCPGSLRTVRWEDGK